MFVLPVFEISVFFNDFRDIWHSISAREGGNTVCCNDMVRNKTDNDSVTCWFLWKHPMARRRGLEFGVFDQTLRKRARRLGPTGLAARFLFPAQNYTSQSIGSSYRVSPFASFGAFSRKHNPNVGLLASPLERCIWLHHTVTPTHTHNFYNLFTRNP